MPRYLETLDAIADHYLETNNPTEALGYLEKIIQSNPESEKHTGNCTGRLSPKPIPDTPYAPPEVPQEAAAVAQSNPRAKRIGDDARR